MVSSIYDTNRYFYIMLTLDAILFRKLPSVKIKTNKSSYITYKSYI